MTQEALNIAGQCRATASSELAKNILVDEGNGLLTELLLDAARIIEALAQTQEPVAWLITDEKINSLQVNSIQRLIDRARHANMTDIKLRINGQDEWFQADWLKHLTRTAPPQRTWVGLTDEQRSQLVTLHHGWNEYGQAIEASLKQQNGYAEENT